VESMYGDKNILYILINPLIKAIEDEKFTKIMKKTTIFHGSCGRHHLESLWANPSTELTARRLCLTPSPNWKRSVFLSLDLFPHWGKQPRCKDDLLPPYLPDSAPMDFFLFPNMMSELAGRLLSQDSFRMSL
jgi:hypothetical protein